MKIIKRRKNHRVLIELNEKEIPTITGALRLGTFLEDWCGHIKSEILNEGFVDHKNNNNFLWRGKIFKLIEDLRGLCTDTDKSDFGLADQDLVMSVKRGFETELIKLGTVAKEIEDYGIQDLFRLKTVCIKKIKRKTGIDPKDLIWPY